MGAERRNHVMSVELAMQREMAYRQTLESLRVERGGGSGGCSTTSSRKDPLPSQHLQMFPSFNNSPSFANSFPTEQVPMPKSSQAPKTTPGPTPNSGPRPTPGFLPNPRPHPYYGPRPRQAPGPMPLVRPPFPGPRSRQSPPSVPNHSTGQKRKQPINCYCDLCQVDCNNPFNLIMHLKGQKHQAKLKEPKGMKITGNVRHHCELCGIRCSNEFTFRQHLNCKNHIFRLHASENKEKGPDGTTAMPRI